MNCTDVDAVWSGVLDGTHSHAIWVVSGVGLVSALVLLGWGRHVVRLAGAVGAAGGAAVVVFAWVPSEGCDGRLLGAGIAAVVAAALALCLSSLALFALAAASAGFVAHAAYVLLPLDSVEPPFRLFGVSGYHVLAVAGGAAAGGALALLKRTAARIVASASAGACLAAGSLTLLLADLHPASPPPQWAGLVVVLVLAPAGALYQTHAAGRAPVADRAVAPSVTPTGWG